MGWADEAREMQDSGVSLTGIALAMQERFPELNAFQVMRKVRTALEKGAKKEPEKEKKEEAPKKIEVVQNFEPAVTKGGWRGAKTVRFGLMGDTQINSKYTQLTHLHDFYDVCSREGITTVYHTGDMDEGEQMRAGHQYECYTQGADDHLAEIVRVYPRRTGIKTNYITGNHDASLMKRAGYNIGPHIERERPDMQYLGQDCAVIELTPNCKLELRHPWDGTAYALSYKLQKMIDAMPGGEKPNLLAVGHYHKTEYLFYRNLHGFQTGTFQAQTPYMRGKGIAAMMGGWIVEIDVEDDGSIRKIKQSFIPYYKAIKDDYLNWR
jgi:hypothetical protein